MDDVTKPIGEGGLFEALDALRNRWESAVYQKRVEQLDQRFFQCHRSFLVNIAFVNDIQRQEAGLKKDKRIQVSRRKHTDFLQLYASFNTI